MSNHFKFGAAARLAATIGAAGAARADDGYGTRVGSFVLSPELEVQTGYSDNYLRSAANDESSVFTVIAPTLRLASDWSRHAFKLDLTHVTAIYYNDTDDNTYEFGAGAELLLDVTRATMLGFDLAYDRNAEGRGSDNSRPGSAEPTYNNHFSGGVKGQYKAGRVRVAPFAGAGYRIYEDTDRIGGGTIDNSDRDRIEYDYGLELGYEYIRGYELFVRGTGRYIDYEDEFDVNGFRQGGEDYAALAGVNFKLTNLIDGSAGAGYRFRTNEDARFDDASSFTYDVGLTWTPTPLWLVSLKGFQAFEETSVPGASTANAVGASIGAEYAIRRNVTLLPSFRYKRLDYEDIDRTDDLFEVGIGVQYSVNRYLAISGEYRYAFEDSDTAGDWSENAFTIGIKTKY